MEQARDELAAAAVAEVRSGMVVGLGTGRAAERAIRALARRVATESMRVVCVASSRASERLGGDLGLAVESMERIDLVDYLFDGADEVDPALRMLKGRGGAMTREKIVAHAAQRRVYLVQATKCVERLGTSASLPIEVMRFGMTAAVRALRQLGLDGCFRQGEAAGREQETDDGNPIFDARLPAGADLAQLEAAITAIPGVVGHGLFLSEADVVLIEDDRGALSRRDRIR